MPEMHSPDGRFVFAIQGDGNEVVYDTKPSWRAVWDRWSYEAQHGGDWGDGGHPGEVMPIPEPPQDLPPIHLPPIFTPQSGKVIRIGAGFRPRMYSDMSNAWVGPDGIYVFAGGDDGMPRFFRVQGDGSVEQLPPLISIPSETEGWTWDQWGSIIFPHGPQLLRVNPFNGEREPLLDIRATHPGCDLWQPHSSDDNRTHVATVRQIVNEGKYPAIGTVISKDARQHFIHAEGELDESSVTRLGTHAIIKETFKRDKKRTDNHIIHIDSGQGYWIRDEEGALGHSDCGPDFIVGEDDQIGGCVKIDLTRPFGPDNRLVLFRSDNMGYVSVRRGVCLTSGSGMLALVNLDGSGVNPIRPHVITDDYDERVKANLDHLALVACYMEHGTVFLMLL